MLSSPRLRYLSFPVGAGAERFPDPPFEIPISARPKAENEETLDECKN